MQTEVHVFAFSVSAGLLLSFFPFLTVVLSICRYVLKWRAGVSAVYFALDDYFPDTFGQFIRRNFEVTVASRGPVQVVSLVLLFFTGQRDLRAFGSGAESRLELFEESKLFQEPVGEPRFDLRVRGADAVFDHAHRLE